MQKVLQYRCTYTDTWKWATNTPGTHTDTHLCSLQYSPAAVGTWSASASLWEWCPWAAAYGTGAYSPPPEINTHTQSQTRTPLSHFALLCICKVRLCMSLFNLGGYVCVYVVPVWKCWSVDLASAWSWSGPGPMTGGCRTLLSVSGTTPPLYHQTETHVHTQTLQLKIVLWLVGKKIK